jgi:hypothetical protein
MVDPEPDGLSAGKAFISGMGLLEDETLGFNASETLALELGAPRSKRAFGGETGCALARWN